jgi:hypothetical protein
MGWKRNLNIVFTIEEYKYVLIDLKLGKIPLTKTMRLRRYGRKPIDGSMLHVSFHVQCASIEAQEHVHSIDIDMSLRTMLAYAQNYCSF